MEIREDSILSPGEQGRIRALEKASVEEEIILEGEQRPHQASQDIARSSVGNAGFGNREESRQSVVSKRKRRPHQESQSIARNTRTDIANEVNGDSCGKNPHKNQKVQKSNYEAWSKKVTAIFLENASAVGNEAPEDKLPESGEKISEAADTTKKIADKLPVLSDKGTESKKNVPYDIAQVLLEQNSFCIIEGQLYLYCKKGYWKLISESEANREIRNIIPEDLRCRVSKGILYEIYEWLRILAPSISDCLKERRCCLNFLDIAYDWESNRLIQNRKELMFKYVLQLPLKCIKQEGKGAYENFIEDTFGYDNETAREFRKFLGLCLSDIRDLKFCFFLYGPSNSGKTVVLNLLKKIVGEEWCSSLSFTQMSNEFAITQLLGKRLSLSGEVSGASNKRLDILKSLTGNDNVTASFKGKDHFQFKNESLLVFACNSFPPVNALEEFDSFLSRVIIFPFSNVVPRDKWIENLEEILLDDAGSIIREAIRGLRELKQDGYCFKESLEMRKCKQSFKGQYNSFALYADEYISKEIDGKVTSDDIRRSYRRFCEEGGYEILPDNVWSLYLKQRYGCLSKTFSVKEDAQDERKRGYQGISIKRGSFDKSADG